MFEGVQNALIELKQYYKDNGLFCKAEIDGYTDFVFLNRYGNVLLQHDLERALIRIIDAYNDAELHNAALKKRKAFLLPHFTCHSLRHTFCTRLCGVESNIKVVQSLMGHIHASTTINDYAEKTEARNRQSMETLGEKWNLY